MSPSGHPNTRVPIGWYEMPVITFPLLGERGVGSKQGTEGQPLRSCTDRSETLTTFGKAAPRLSPAAPRAGAPPSAPAQPPERMRGSVHTAAGEPVTHVKIALDLSILLFLFLKPLLYKPSTWGNVLIKHNSGTERRRLN